MNHRNNEWKKTLHLLCSLFHTRFGIQNHLHIQSVPHGIWLTCFTRRCVQPLLKSRRLPLDDVSAQAVKASSKAAGVVIDDAAVIRQSMSWDYLQLESCQSYGISLKDHCVTNYLSYFRHHGSRSSCTQSTRTTIGFRWPVSLFRRLRKTTPCNS